MLTFYIPEGCDASYKSRKSRDKKVGRLDKQQQANEAAPVYKSRNTVLFEQLPEKFTFFDASRETVLKMIRRWAKRGFCKKIEGDTEMWQKEAIPA